ncbi:MAG: hypothetical protein Q8P57_04830 [Candidatus Pacearchaeota archaeon]|nr:hypothetical protein [Candidatus Pacearchaeota archaeon]
MKKRRAKEVFESADRTREHAYVIFPGEEMIEVTLEGSNTEKEVKFDFSKIRKLYDERKRTYVTAHEHPMKTEEHTGYLTVPSIADVRGFLLDDFARMEVIAQRNSETGKIEGYFCLRKTRATPKVGYSPMYKDEIDRSNPELRERAQEIGKATAKYERCVEKNQIRKGIDELSQQFHLKYRFVPAVGYKLDERLTNFYRPEEREAKEKKIREEFEKSLRKQDGGLDRLLDRYHFGKEFVLLISLMIFGSSFFFLGSGVTGNVVGNLNNNSGNHVGIILFLIGLVGIVGYFKRK